MGAISGNWEVGPHTCENGVVQVNTTFTQKMSCPHGIRSSWLKVTLSLCPLSGHICPTQTTVWPGHKGAPGDKCLDIDSLTERTAYDDIYHQPGVQRYTSTTQCEVSSLWKHLHADSILATGKQQEVLQLVCLHQGDRGSPWKRVAFWQLASSRRSSSLFAYIREIEAHHGRG